METSYDKIYTASEAQTIINGINNKVDEPNELGFELEKLNERINHEYVKLNKQSK